MDNLRKGVTIGGIGLLIAGAAYLLWRNTDYNPTSTDLLPQPTATISAPFLEDKIAQSQPPALATPSGDIYCPSLEKLNVSLDSGLQDTINLLIMGITDYNITYYGWRLAVLRDELIKKGMETKSVWALPIRTALSQDITYKDQKIGKSGTPYELVCSPRK